MSIFSDMRAARFSAALYSHTRAREAHEPACHEAQPHYAALLRALLEVELAVVLVIGLRGSTR